MEKINPNPEEIKEAPKLQSLDVKGREIRGLEPKVERFSPLKEGDDFAVLLRNNNLISTPPAEDEIIFVDPVGGAEERVVEAPHWRAASKDGVKAVFQGSSLKDYFYTANVKGVGYLKPTLKGGRKFNKYDDWKRTDEYGFKGAYGLAEEDDFIDGKENIVEKSSRLIGEGFRTECYGVVAKLKNVYYQGKITPIKELKNKKIIPASKKFEPHIGVRYLKLNNRVEEVKESGFDRARELFERAFNVFNKEVKDKGLQFPEIKLGDRLGEEIFFKEFFARMGGNLGIMQNEGLICWHLHASNITLAAEIVDIGPIMTLKAFKDKGDEEVADKFEGIAIGFLKDMRDVSYALKFLINSGEAQGMSIGDKIDLLKAFLTAYKSRLQSRQANLYGACEKILKAVLIEGRQLAGLKHGTPKDWGINFK